ncbi:MAG: tetratricopeptide repeat protein [Pseudomonadota bacterium]
MKKYIFASLAACLMAPAAIAQVFVVGGGQGAECYKAAKVDHLSPHQAERVCSNALRESTITRGNKAATHVNRGILRMRSAKYEEALDDYTRATKLVPDLGEAFVNRGAALIYLGDYQNAIPALTRAIDLDSSQLFAAYYNRGIARENSGDISGAYEDFKKADELRPDWDLVKMQLSRFRVG